MFSFSLGGLKFNCAVLNITEKSTHLFLGYVPLYFERLAIGYYRPHITLIAVQVGGKGHFRTFSSFHHCHSPPVVYQTLHHAPQAAENFPSTVPPWDSVSIAIPICPAW